MAEGSAAVSGNIGDKAAVAKMKEEIEAKLGRVDILVNCAGGDIGAAGGKPEPNDALGIPLEDIRALTENNLYGTILVCQAFVPPMVKAGSGSVINIGSAAAQFGVTNGVIYAALKAAVDPLHALPRGDGPDGGRSDQCGEPGRHQDRALRGDPCRRSAKDGFVDQVADPLWGAGRDGRRGRLPRRPKKQIYQRPGSSGGRRGNAVSGMRNCLEDTRSDGTTIVIASVSRAIQESRAPYGPLDRRVASLLAMTSAIQFARILYRNNIRRFESVGRQTV